MNICNSPDVLKTILIIKTFLDIVLIVLPIILIVLSMIDLFKVVIGKSDEIPQALKIITKRTIAALIVFLLPVALSTVFSLVNDVSSDADKFLCWNEATPENIEIAKLKEEAQKKAEKEEEKKKKEEYLNSIKKPPASQPTIQSGTNNKVYKSYRSTPFVNGEQRALNPGECMTAQDNCSCPTIGKFQGFSFVMAGEKDRSFSEAGPTDPTTTVKVQCSDGTYISKTVNIKTENNFRQAFEKICQLRTTGINGVKIPSEYLRIDGTLVRRTNSARTICSPHAYGIAIDINYDLTINVNGTNYKPYAGQGTKTRQNYNNFVNIIGGESNEKNVNYILWKYAFEPSGFIWGGNWSDGSFDPMHFEVAQ